MKLVSKNQNNNNQIKINKSHGMLFYFLISCAVIIIGIFIMSKKEGMDFDEVGTFGLANNTFQLDIENFKEYSGEELLLKYASVKDGEEFNVGNVFFNQKMDTHPPLYYLLVNFVCSIRKGTFSMWYGLIINLFFMLILFWEMRYLFNLVIEDELVSTLASFIAFFSYGFVNEIVFIRMYVMLSAISMAFVILAVKIIKSYSSNLNVGENVNVALTVRDDSVSMNKTNTVLSSYASPLIFFLLCLLGILTQYHFMIIAFYFSIVIGIFLIYKKDFKFLLLLVLAGVLSIILALIIFPGMINHMFGETSLHALNDRQFHSMGEKFYGIALTIYRSFFGAGIYPYLALLLLAIIILFIKVKKDKINIKQIVVDNKWFFIFLLACIFYYIIICCTSKYTFARYLYNIYPLIIICIISIIYLLFKYLSPKLKYISLAIILLLVITSRLNSTPFSLNIGNNIFFEYLNDHRDIKILGLYRSVDSKLGIGTQATSLWKLPRPLHLFRSMKSIFFSDLSDNTDLLYFREDKIASNDSLFVVIYTAEDDNEILGGLMRSNGFTQVNKVLDNTYYHMYLIAK